MNADEMINEKLYSALECFIARIRPYVVLKMKFFFGKDWDSEKWQFITNFHFQNLNQTPISASELQSKIDFHHLKKIAINYKDVFKIDFDYKVNNLPTWFDDISVVRHKLAHFQIMDKEEVSRAYSNMIIIMRQIGDKDAVDKLCVLRDGENSDVKKIVTKDVSNKAYSQVYQSNTQTVNCHVDVQGIKINLYRNKDGQIQDCLKEVFYMLFKHNLLSSREIERLQDNEYCKKKFKGLGFPLLRKIGGGRLINGRGRYYRETFGNEFFLCSQWWREYHAENFEKIKEYLEYLKE